MKVLRVLRPDLRMPLETGPDQAFVDAAETVRAALSAEGPLVPLDAHGFTVGVAHPRPHHVAMYMVDDGVMALSVLRHRKNLWALLFRRETFGADDELALLEALKRALAPLGGAWAESEIDDPLG